MWLWRFLAFELVVLPLFENLWRDGPALMSTDVQLDGLCSLHCGFDPTSNVVPTVSFWVCGLHRILMPGILGSWSACP